MIGKVNPLDTAELKNGIIVKKVAKMGLGIHIYLPSDNFSVGDEVVVIKKSVFDKLGGTWVIIKEEGYEAIMTLLNKGNQPKD